MKKLRAAKICFIVFIYYFISENKNKRMKKKREMK